MEQGQSAKVNSERLIYKPLSQFQGNQSNLRNQIHLLFTKDHYDTFILADSCKQNPTFYQVYSSRFSPTYQSTTAYINFFLHQKFKLQNMTNSQIQQNMMSPQVLSNLSQSQIQQNANQYKQQNNIKVNQFSETPMFTPQSQSEEENLNQITQFPKQIQIQTKSFSDQNNSKQLGDQDTQPQLNQQNSLNFQIKENKIPNKDIPYTKYPSFNDLQQSQTTKNEGNMSDISRCFSCSKRILSFSEYYQIQNSKTKNVDKICKNCNLKLSKITNGNKVMVTINSESYYFLNDDQNKHFQNLLNDKKNEQIPNTNANNNNNNNGYKIQNNSHIRNNSVNTFVSPPQNTQPKSTEDLTQPFQNNNTFDFNFNSINQKEQQLNLQQRNEIPLVGSAFVIDQFSQFEPIKQQYQPPKLQPVRPQSYKKSQIVPVLQYESDEEDQLMQLDDEDQNNNANQVQNKKTDSNQNTAINQLKDKNSSKDDKKIDISKCVRCKLPFKSTKYIIKGKKLALLCNECLESMLKDLKKDQKQIVIEDQTYKFGESVIARIKEQSLIEKEIKKDNVIIPKENISNQQNNAVSQSNQSANYFNYPINPQNNNFNQFNYPVNPQNQQINQQVNSQRNQNQNQNIYQNANQSQSLLKCNQCNQMAHSTYEVLLVQKGGKEETNRVCQECVYTFVLYYEHPSQFVKFGGNTYKINDLFAKYLYYSQVNQVKASAQSQDQNKYTIQSKNLNCFICKTKCKERLQIVCKDDPKTILFIGHTCFYYNLSCIQDNKYFIYENKTYLLDKDLQQLAKEHMMVQLNLYSKSTSY